jgi:hypothetical protein|tara:strand:- start:1821 stop:2072 length:252 start_codon:yes stop_codon:yes gene_type:complete
MFFKNIKRARNSIRLERVTPQLPLVGKASYFCCGGKRGSKLEMLSDRRFNSFLFLPILTIRCQGDEMILRTEIVFISAVRGFG